MARPNKGEEKGWRVPFLKALCEKPYVAYACRTAGISRSGAYKARKSDEEFSAAWDDAIETGLDESEFELHEIGIGKMKGQYGALIYLLKARRYEVRSGTDAPPGLYLAWGPPPAKD